jgi:hypothetical protein
MNLTFSSLWTGDRMGGTFRFLLSAFGFRVLFFHLGTGLSPRPLAEENSHWRSVSGRPGFRFPLSAFRFPL